jgi:predicted small metal-binding protein
MAKEVTCPSPCSFRVRSEKEDELVTMVQQHAKNAHQKDVSRSDVLGMAKTV